MKYDTSLYRAMQWREIGPFRGGRSIAVAGHKDLQYTYYFGATGGGIWKTEDGGNIWVNVSDGFLKVGIVGALAVAESDPNVIYAGTGEACIRGNTMPGEGMYKSTDAGKTWKFSGLGEAQTISEIAVHPKDADLVYAAAFGHVFGSNPERGVYRSKDGGKTWQKIHFVNDKTGSVDIVLDPMNPRVVYASMWEAFRNPWSMSSGGPGSGLWKSTDGGDTWTDVSRNQGMPKTVLGKICVAASGAQRDLVWAMVEAEPDGGLYRSNDGGKTWRRVNDDRRLRQRSWYYSHVYADPKSSETVYILNTAFFRSNDGGRSLTRIFTPHGDSHDLWIDPNNPQRMIEGNDGSANISYNGGRTWTDQDVATAQFYHVLVDNQFPYYVYGDQQDNSTVAIASRAAGGGIDRPDWWSVGGGESGYIAVHPEKPYIVYAGNYGGLLTRYDHRTRQAEPINVWPENPMGGGAESMKYRFQWTFPIVISPHDPNVLYATGNHVFKTTNEGKSWEMVSPDLTRNDKSKQGPSGGPITKDNTGVEYYCTIFTFAESSVQKGVLWAGSDDGLIHVSTDAGANWKNVTPKDLQDWSRISLIDPSPHDAGSAYLAVKRYQMDDFKPYMYKTTDFGKTWKKIVRGVPDYEFVHAVREDPNKKGMLYAGTERGVWVSFDDGENWQPLQMNLPVVPIHDLMVQAREKDLVVATHGRSFWILDDLTPLYQLNDAVAKSRMFLYQPRHVYRMRSGGFGGGAGASARPTGRNPSNGAVVYYYFKDPPKDEVKLDFLDGNGKLMKSFSSKQDRQEGTQQPPETPFGPGAGQQRVSTDSGMNRFVWDLRVTDATAVPGAIFWAGNIRGPVVAPGSYTVRLAVGKDTLRQTFELKKDPRLETTQEEFAEQFSLAMKIKDKLSAAHEAINTIREIKKQAEELTKKSANHPSKNTVADAAKKLGEKLSAVEEELIQVKIKSNQDALNYPIKLNNKLAALAGNVGSADTKPTRQQLEVFADLSARTDVQLTKLKDILATEVPAFNKLIKEQDIPAVILKSEQRGR
ncbi:MAG: glycosyl hydrolase [Ignavibacteriales bacterium]|nr:glycosyl hydrolase [Ignavibacteriales bacterium]